MFHSGRRKKNKIKSVQRIVVWLVKWTYVWSYEDKSHETEKEKARYSLTNTTATGTFSIIHIRKANETISRAASIIFNQSTIWCFVFRAALKFISDGFSTSHGAFMTAGQYLFFRDAFSLSTSTKSLNYSVMEIIFECTHRQVDFPTSKGGN